MSDRDQKTLERERELNKNPNPGTIKHKEKVFGKAYGDLSRVARGIVEEDEDQSECEDREEDMTDDEEVMFSRWAKLAARDKETEELIRERVRSHRTRVISERKKKKDADCIGNPYHRGGSESGESSKAGQFSSKGDAKSRSIRNKNNTNCNPGTTRMPGNKWIKNVKDCGREGSKRYKCSTDALKEYDLDTALYHRDRTFRESEIIKGIMDYFASCSRATGTDKVNEKKRPLQHYDREQIRHICGRYNLMSLEQFLAILDKIERAKSGKINQPANPKV
jgi:hypothetical protein